MTKTDFKTVDEYISTFSESVQDILETVRRTIRDAVPDAEEEKRRLVTKYRPSSSMVGSSIKARARTRARALHEHRH